MFKGEYGCKADAKGRITLPVKIREQLGEGTFVVTRGMDGCIDLYPLNDWEKIEKRLESLTITNKNQRMYKRFILSAASEVEIDGQGRIKLPVSLIDYAELEKNIIVTGMSDHIEVWSKEKWSEYVESAEENIEDIVNEIDF